MSSGWTLVEEWRKLSIKYRFGISAVEVPMFKMFFLSKCLCNQRGFRIAMFDR